LTAGGGVGATQATALPETPLNVEFKNSEKMPLANMLDLIATRLGINWEYNAEKGLVRFYRLVTKTWQLPMAGGTNSFTTEFKQSAEGGSSGGGSGGSGQSAQIDAAAKAEIKEQNDLEGVKKSILPAMTMVGSAELNPATGVLTLRHQGSGRCGRRDHPQADRDLLAHGDPEVPDDRPDGLGRG
jgi:hypothetical protein